MRYLSGVPYAPAMAWDRGGVMFTPEMGNRLQLDGVTWAADNGCYTAGERFSERHWLDWLAEYRGQGRCLFAVLPDVPPSPDMPLSHAATLARSMPYVDAVRQLGYPVALAIQNGASAYTIPWPEIDAVFIAGNVPWKTSQTARRICIEALERGKHVHVARRNSWKAVQAAYDMGAHTVDGTFLRFAPDQNWERLQDWFIRLCEHSDTEVWGADGRFSRCRVCDARLWRVG